MREVEAKMAGQRIRRSDFRRDSHNPLGYLVSWVAKWIMWSSSKTFLEKAFQHLKGWCPINLWTSAFLISKGFRGWCGQP